MFPFTNFNLPGFSKSLKRSLCLKCHVFSLERGKLTNVPFKPRALSLLPNSQITSKWLIFYIQNTLLVTIYKINHGT